MPRKRASGAQKPFPYRHTRKVRGKDGEVRTVTTERWKATLIDGYGVDGKPHVVQFTASTYRECLRKLNEARERLRTTGSAEPAAKATLAQYAAMFLREARTRLAPATYNGYESRLGKVLPRYGHVLVKDVTPGMVREMLHMFDDRSWSWRHTLLTCLNQMFDMAVEDRAITTNPAGTVRLRKVKGDTGAKGAAYSVPELKMMLLQASQGDPCTGARMWWRMLTGMRQGEICGCLLEDLHLDAPQPYYELKWSMAEIPKEHGCGEPVRGVWPCGMKRGGNCPEGKWRVPNGFVMRPLRDRWCLKTPKSGRSRIVPLPAPLVEAVRRYLAHVASWPNPHGLLWIHEDGSPVTLKQDTADFKRLLEECGMDPRERRGHETRYSAVTLLRKAGVDTKTVLEIVGHTTMAVDDIYRTVDMEEKAEAMNELGESLQLPKGLLPGGADS